MTDTAPIIDQKHEVGLTWNDREIINGQLKNRSYQIKIKIIFH